MLVVLYSCNYNQLYKSQRYLKKIKLSILFIFFINIVFSQFIYKNSIEGNISYGRLLSHRNSMHKLIQNNSIAGEITYNWNTYGVKPHHKEFNFPVYGLSLNLNNSGNLNNIGYIYSIYSFVSIPISKHKKPYRIKVGLGTAFADKIFDLQSNYQALALGSNINANVILRVEKNIIIDNKKDIYFGIGLNHVSNAAFKTPNLGLNFISINLGITLFRNKINLDSIIKKPIASYNKFQFDIINSSALKENITPLQDKFYINETSLQYKYRKGLKSSYIIGSDFLVNPSLIEFTNKKIQLGIFTGHILHLDKLKLGVIMGTYVYNIKQKSETFYHKLFSEYDLNNNLSIRLSLKSHWAKADFFSLGVGYKIFKR